MVEMSVSFPPYESQSALLTHSALTSGFVMPKRCCLHAGHCGNTVVGSMLAHLPDICWGGFVLSLREEHQKILFLELKSDYKSYFEQG